jgi:hypothetical protein
VPGHSEKCFRRKKKFRHFGHVRGKMGLLKMTFYNQLKKKCFLPNNLKARQSELSFWGRIRNTSFFFVTKGSFTRESDLELGLQVLKKKKKE